MGKYFGKNVAPNWPAIQKLQYLQGGRWVCLHWGCRIQTASWTNWGVSSLTGFSFDIWVEIFKNLQADYISLSPGKTHSVKVFGSHITTSRNPSTWKLEGRLSSHIHWLNLHSCLLWCDRGLLASEDLSKLAHPKTWDEVGVQISGLLKMESLSPPTRGCRFSWENETLRYHSRCPELREVYGHFPYTP